MICSMLSMFCFLSCWLLWLCSLLVLNVLFLALPSEVATLILSDVVGDKLEFIASGPTVYDTTTFEDAWRIVDALDLEHKIPPKVVVHLERGRKLNSPPLIEKKEINKKRVQTLVVGNNRKAITAVEKKAKKLGYNTLLLSSQISGEAREVAKVLAGITFDIQRFEHPIKKPAISAPAKIPPACSTPPASATSTIIPPS